MTGIAASLMEESLLIRLTKPISPLFCVPVAVGTRNHLWAATSPDVVSGMYYEPVGKPAKGSRDTRDGDLLKRLWKWTENELQRVDLIGK